MADQRETRDRGRDQPAPPDGGMYGLGNDPGVAEDTFADGESAFGPSGLVERMTNLLAAEGGWHQPNSNPSTRSARRKRDDGVAEIYWPALRPLLQTEEDLQDFKFHCSVCLENKHYIVVLDCNHMLCSGCAQRIKSPRPYIDWTKKCPFCEANFGMLPNCRPDCSNGAVGYSYGTEFPRTMAEYHNFPLTLAEDAARSGACARCRRYEDKRSGGNDTAHFQQRNGVQVNKGNVNLGNFNAGGG